MCFLIFGRNIICNIATVVVVVVIYFALQLCAYLQPNVGFICLLLLCYWLFCFNFLFEKKKKNENWINKRCFLFSTIFFMEIDRYIKIDISIK